MGESKIATREFTKEKFLQLSEKYGFIGWVVHEDNEHQTIITDDKVLTNELHILKDAVKRFERNTNIEIKVH